MKTRTVGEILQAERLKRHLSLERLAAVTHISLDHLQNIEANQFDQLPSATYVRGYIRSMARELNLDPEPLISILRRDYKESARGELLPRELLQPAAPRALRMTGINLAVLLLVGVVGVMVGYGLIQVYVASLPPKLVVLQPTQFAKASSVVTVAGSTDPDVSILVDDVPSRVDAIDGSFTEELTFTTQGLQSVRVEAVNRRGNRSEVIREVIVEF